MKLVCISDTHGLHNKLILPEGDVLVYAGDFSSYGNWSDTKDFLHWFNEQDFKFRILTAGNHDKIPYIYFSDFINEIIKTKIIYLQDYSIIIEGIKFFGTPWSLPFGIWSFMKSEKDLLKIFNSIPLDTDVIISHGPCHGILDQTYYANGDIDCNCGSFALKETVKRIKPKIVITGHIHESFGKYTDYKTDYYNVSVVDEFYKVVNPPTIIEI